MRLRSLILLIALPAMAIAVSAQAITGTILIKKKLTKPSVTAAVSVYQRGTAIKLGEEAEKDPLAYERSRVVIYLEGPAPAGASTGGHVTEQIRQLDRRFVPEMVVVPVGSTVSFPNMDPIFHNIYSLSKPRTFDLGSYDKGESRTVTFPRPGIVEVYCHLHPSMSATVFVTPNRWYARPDHEGQYRISDVPPGRYTLVAWHRTAGFFRKTIVVDGNHDVTADFFIPLDEAGTKPDQNEAQDEELGRSAGAR